MFRENYHRYRKSGQSEDISFSKEDIRRVETFANQIEKKLVKAKKTFEDVFVNRIKSRDGNFQFEEVKNVILFNLQMEESLDCRMLLRYIQNSGGN
jgi:hypothetical protein